jgi:hypothetical protein
MFNHCWHVVDPHRFFYAAPDPAFYLNADRIRIQGPELMRIRILVGQKSQKVKYLKQAIGQNTNRYLRRYKILF